MTEAADAFQALIEADMAEVLLGELSEEIQYTITTDDPDVVYNYNVQAIVTEAPLTVQVYSSETVSRQTAQVLMGIDFAIEGGGQFYPKLTDQLMFHGSSWAIRVIDNIDYDSRTTTLTVVTIEDIEKASSRYRMIQ